MKQQQTNKPYMVVLAVVLVAIAAFLGYRAYGALADAGGEPDIKAMMPKTGQAPPVTPEEVAGAPKGVLPGGKRE